jgi:23S rRNA pseudouridine1911/1915/1917 synthase
VPDSAHLTRLVDHAKAHLVVVPVGDVGPLIAAGALTINGRVAKIADPVTPGDAIVVDPIALATVALAPEDVALTIRHEDDDLVICDKPAGMHVHPLGVHRTGTLLNALLWRSGARPDHPWAPWRPSPLHRLDRAASGLVAFAKTAAIHDVMRRLFEANGIERRYRAIVRGHLTTDAGVIDAPLGRDPALDYRRAIVPLEHGGQRAITHYTVVERSGDSTTGHTVVDVTLETGRTHQIRAHMASIGHPLLGDALYAPGASRTDATTSIALHATELRLRHPRSNAELIVTSPAPAALASREAPRRVVQVVH